MPVNVKRIPINPKYLISWMMLACFFSLPGQTSSDKVIEFSNEDIGVKANSLPALAEALTKEKTSEKEKFDAIFAWVASNIHYDFATYYSSNGSGTTNFKKMLRYRSGICIDFAALMDTLCSLSGLQNTTIYGYAKDEIFDVNDSIYVDNHAWNAVKLDGLWYVYDVTWASGNVGYDFTPFSKLLLRFEKKFPVKYRQKSKWMNKTVLFDECGDEIKMPVFYREKWFNKFMRSVLHIFRLRVRQYYTRKINLDYYLVEPEVLSVTHFPDNPSWSLTANKKMRIFEQDSAYYHLTETVYSVQQRQGRACPDCDYDLSLDPLNKQHYMRKRSLAFNRRNRFITSLCEYRIASILLHKSREVDDSAQKIGLLDTATVYLQHSKTSLRTSFRNIDFDFQLQGAKNKRKQMLLLSENRKYLDFIKERRSITGFEGRNARFLRTKIQVCAKKLSRRRAILRQLKTKVALDKKSRSTEEHSELMRLHNKILHEIDSLTALINTVKQRFDSASGPLSASIWQKVIYHDSLVLPFIETTRLRNLLSDNLRKPVVEVRKKIPVYQSHYLYNMDQDVYSPADTLYRLGFWLTFLINGRISAEKELYQVKQQLCKLNMLPMAELGGLKIFMQRENDEDYCWLKKRSPVIMNIENGFLSVKQRLTYALNVLVRENEIERRRTHFVAKELLRRKKKYSRIIVHNTHVTALKLIETRKEKRDYLNLLKRERRRASKKN